MSTPPVPTVWLTFGASYKLSQADSLDAQMAGCGLIFAALLINRWGVISKAIRTLARQKNPGQSG
ncbi:MAG: hypothetical protein B7X58_09495 [Marinobacter sp. 34-60-7]|nr:MAG: hypothetical protein B7X58_09495 [Marinobacter sp. 34-60-7]